MIWPRDVRVETRRCRRLYSLRKKALMYAAIHFIPINAGLVEEANNHGHEDGILGGLLHPNNLIDMDKFRNRYRIASARLASWDYGASGLYYVTVNTRRRKKFFGQIVQDENGQPILILSPIGIIAQTCWNEIPQHFSFVQLDAFTLMPDHLHGIICFNKIGERCWQANRKGPQKDTLGVVVGSYKSAVTFAARKEDPSFSWQGRFWDHIIRSIEDLNRIRLYIDNNIRKWWDKFGT